jgi:hypothetical protein
MAVERMEPRAGRTEGCLLTEIVCGIEFIRFGSGADRLG